MKQIRSILFIPGDSEKKLGKADGFRPDALVLDLEDSVVPARKAIARDMVREFLAARPERPRSQLWVRINPIDHPDVLADLAAIVGARPDGIMQPKANGPEDVARLSYYLDALEARDGVPAGHVRILPVATETAIAPFRLGDYATAKLPRLMGLTWGAEDLSSAIGASARPVCWRPMPPGSRRSTRSMWITAIRKACAPPARSPGSRASPAGWRSIPTRSTSSTKASRPRRRMSPMPVG
jgi:citrate lyase beta subunit